MRFTPSKVNDGKILVFVDLSEINYKPLPTRSRPVTTRSPPRSRPASRRCRRSWPRSKPWRRFSGRTSSVSGPIGS
jgi:hypothetical protein